MEGRDSQAKLKSGLEAKAEEDMQLTFVVETADKKGKGTVLGEGEVRVACRAGKALGRHIASAAQRAVGAWPLRTGAAVGDAAAAERSWPSAASRVDGCLARGR